MGKYLVFGNFGKNEPSRARDYFLTPCGHPGTSQLAVERAASRHRRPSVYRAEGLLCGVRPCFGVGNSTPTGPSNMPGRGSKFPLPWLLEMINATMIVDCNNKLAVFSWARAIPSHAYIAMPCLLQPRGDGVVCGTVVLPIGCSTGFVPFVETNVTHSRVPPSAK